MCSSVMGAQDTHTTNNIKINNQSCLLISTQQVFPIKRVGDFLLESLAINKSSQNKKNWRMGILMLRLAVIHTLKELVDLECIQVFLCEDTMKDL